MVNVVCLVQTISFHNMFVTEATPSVSSQFSHPLGGQCGSHSLTMGTSPNTRRLDGNMHLRFINHNRSSMVKSFHEGTGKPMNICNVTLSRGMKVLSWTHPCIGRSHTLSADVAIGNGRRVFVHLYATEYEILTWRLHCIACKCESKLYICNEVL